MELRRRRMRTGADQGRRMHAILSATSLPKCDALWPPSRGSHRSLLPCRQSVTLGPYAWGAWWPLGERCSTIGARGTIVASDGMHRTFGSLSALHRSVVWCNWIAFIRSDGVAELVSPAWSVHRRGFVSLPSPFLARVPQTSSGRLTRGRGMHPSRSTSPRSRSMQR